MCRCSWNTQKHLTATGGTCGQKGQPLQWQEGG